MSSYYEKITATGEVKCIDEEIPFEIPQRWEWCRMGSIGDWGAGATPAKGNPDYYGGSILWLRTGELNNGIVYDSEIKVTKKALQKCSLRMNRIGDVLIAMYGATIGKVAIVGKELTTNQACCACTPFGIYNYFLFFFLMGSQIDFIKKGEGGAQPNISREKLVSHLMPIPPLAEQYRIVEKIQYLLPLVEKYSDGQILQDKLNSEIKDKLRKSILQEAIQGKLVPQIAEEGTAEELLEQIKTEKQKLVKEGKLKKTALNDSVIFRGDDNKYYEQIGKKCLDITEQIPFEIPSSWEWCRVRNVSNSYIGLTYKPTDIDKKGTIVLRSCNIRNGKLALDDIVRVSSSISEKLLIEENDIIICARNGSKRLVGKSALIRNLPEPMTFGAFMAICKTPIYEYMFAYLQSDLFFGQLRDVSNTTTINQLTQNKFNDFLIPIPPVKEQERIAFKISQLFQELC
ncbi:restriction endonuclease subunit S [Prevotella sp. B2-R-102]|nr:restriction endonuclease subunit S [Prevotella sp. B2-R-102]MDF4242062.1 restriction endonuclease subunit S [Prevotella sp. B2-R-102]